MGARAKAQIFYMQSVTEIFPLDVNAAAYVLKTVVLKTPLQYHRKLSEKFQAEIYLKREDLQVVRSYKLRGAFNLIQFWAPKNGIVVWCAPAPAIMHKVWLSRANTLVSKA